MLNDRIPANIMEIARSVRLSALLLSFLISVSGIAKPSQLYRLVDRNLGCGPQSEIAVFPGHSVSTCASACKLYETCGMFALDNMKSMDFTQSKPRAGITVACQLCKSGNMTSTISKPGWSTYMKWMKEVKFTVLPTDNEAAQPNLPLQEPWYVDCNNPAVTKNRNGIIIAMWDDKDGFVDLDMVKCFNWDDEDILSDKPARVLHVHLEDYRECPRDYVLTAISASNTDFRNVDRGKCNALKAPLSIDYERCVTVSSEGKDGGSTDKWRPWKVQCPTLGPQVAVSLHRRRRIHTGLKCCVLVGLTKDDNKIA